MRPTALGNHATLRRAIKEADAQQEWFKHILKCVWRLTQECRHGGNTDRSPIKLVEHHLQQFSIGGIKASIVNLQAGKCLRGALQRDFTRPGDLHLVAHATKEAVGDAWCAATSCRNERRRFACDADAEDSGGALHDCGELVVSIEVEALHRAESITQWC
jgi:hypothetical protein